MLLLLPRPQRCLSRRHIIYLLPCDDCRVVTLVRVRRSFLGYCALFLTRVLSVYTLLWSPSRDALAGDSLLFWQACSLFRYCCSLRVFSRHVLYSLESTHCIRGYLQSICGTDPLSSRGMHESSTGYSLAQGICG